MPGTSSSPTPAVSSSQHPGPAGDRAGSTTTIPRGSQHHGTTAASGGLATRSDLRSGLALAWCRRHAVFLMVLLAGVACRILAWLAFSPAMVVSESASHLSFVTTWTPSAAHPVGYGVLELTPLSWFTDALAPVVAVQHLLGLATGIVVYILLLRWGVWRWLAALATVPVLLDAYQLASEHLVLPDTLFVFVVAVALLLLCWRARPGVVAALFGGVLLGAATTVRLMGESLVLAALIFILLAGSTWRSRIAGALVVTVGFAIPVVPSVAWYHHTHGEYAFAQGRAHSDSGVDAPPSRGEDYVPDGFAMLFDWSRTDRYADDDIDTWRFGNYVAPEASPTSDVLYVRHGREQLQAHQPGADALVTYQRFGYLPGPFLLGALILGLLAAAGVGRARLSGMRAVCLLTSLVPAGMLLGAASAGELSWRYQLPGLVLLPAAGALGLTALLRGRRSPAAGRSQIDEVDRASLADFRESYGELTLAPVVVVIAAYNEAVGLPRVLSSMPAVVCGLAVDVVVVDDGSTDETAAAVKAHGGAYLVSCTVNRGQGAAMRLGYRVARDHAARYIVTTDADAQYDTADFPTVLAPLLEGSADFVTGSRRLGRQHTNDRFRRTGVYVFAWIVSALTGERLTDTSFGLRAMRAEITAAVTLNQPQYQSAELLIGAHSHGYRIAEVPGTMHVRAAGSTKKGGNLVYGMRYARVVLGTWWREGCPAPAGDRAPAIPGHRGPTGAPIDPGP
ncbi:MAG: glycosyltransferase [Nocardioidaceae bacterium]|nr:glycosyltransferase [Nocardioidaceae bacterium]